MDNEVKYEVIYYLQKENERLEKENRLLQDTIKNQKKTNSLLLKKLNDLKYQIKKDKKDDYNLIDLGYNPYQE